MKTLTIIKSVMWTMFVTASFIVATALIVQWDFDRKHWKYHSAYRIEIRNNSTATWEFYGDAYRLSKSNMEIVDKSPTLTQNFMESGDLKPGEWIIYEGDFHFNEPGVEFTFDEHDSGFKSGIIDFRGGSWLVEFYDNNGGKPNMRITSDGLGSSIRDLRGEYITDSSN